MQYKNIIFDFGNVLADWNPKALALKFAQNEEESRLMREAIFQNWSSLDTGEPPYDQFCADVLQKLPPALHQKTQALLTTWPRHIPYVAGMQELIPRLKEKGYRLYLLSNAPAMLKDHLDFYEILRYFDGVVISGDIRLIKPNKEIYQYILDKYSLDPTQCLFIDDLTANVAAARACGIDSVLFEGKSEQIEHLLLAD